MKKSKLFLGAATLVLAVSAMFATKANKRFFATSTIYSPGGVAFQVSNNLLITTKSSGSTKELDLGILTATNHVGVQFSGPMYTSTAAVKKIVYWQ